MNWTSLTRPRSKAGTAQPHPACAGTLSSPRKGAACALLTLSGLLLAALGCGHDSSAQTVPGADAEEVATRSPGQAAREMLDRGPRVELPEEARQRISGMMEQLTPLDPTLTSDYLDRHFIANQKLVRELCEGPQEVGLAALQAYAAYDGPDVGIRRALLEVAAHSAPEDARALLVHLTLEYGYPLSDRTECARLLALTAPETYLEIAREFVTRKTRLSRTMPPDEFLVRAWVTACRQLGRSPVEEMSDVVMNLLMEDAARHYAAEVLGDYSDARGLRALEMAMIESSGNAYLRRKAAQSLAKAMPRETACDLFYRTLELESNLNFAAFLRSMIEYHCGGSR